MVNEFTAWVRQFWDLNPCTNVYGLSRSLSAFGIFVTVLLNPPTVLFHPVAGMDELHQCGGLAAYGLFCIVPLEWGRWVAVFTLTVVIIGWRPRLTGVLHWYVTASFVAAISLPEGGYQMASNLALLLVPVTLVDDRRWHWSSRGLTSPIQRVVGNTALLGVRIQVFIIYLNASIAKLFVEEWVDGTAVYYWIGFPTLGPGGIRGAVLEFIAANPVGVTMLTWGTVVVEFVLALGLVASRSMRKALLVLGLVFHASIGVVFGLVSFGIILTGLLILYLWPRDEEVDLSAIREMVTRLLYRSGAVVRR